MTYRGQPPWSTECTEFYTFLPSYMYAPFGYVNLQIDDKYKKFIYQIKSTKIAQIKCLQRFTKAR